MDFKVPPIFKFSLIPAPPVTFNAPVVEVVLVVPLVIDASPVDFKVPPTFKFSLIPAPPVTFNAPDVEVVLVVPLVIAVLPPTFKVVPIFTLSDIPIPPDTINAPLVVLLLCVPEVMETPCVKVADPLAVIVPDTSKLPVTTVLLFIFIPPDPADIFISGVFAEFCDPDVIFNMPSVLFFIFEPLLKANDSSE